MEGMALRNTVETLLYRHTWDQKFVLISEVFLFQGGIMNLYQVGTRSSVLINQVSLFQGCPLRGVPLYVVISLAFQ